MSQPAPQSQTRVCEVLSRLDAVTAEYPGGITIERDSARALPWSCVIACGVKGYGFGKTMIDAVEDALRDHDEQAWDALR